MNQLFIHPYLDEHVSVLVATLLRARAFEATTTLEASMIGRSDAQQLAYATERDMAIVTHNRVHFETLAKQYLDEAKAHTGIIIAVRRTPFEIARRLLVVMNNVAADEMANQVRYI